MVGAGLVVVGLGRVVLVGVAEGAGWVRVLTGVGRPDDVAAGRVVEATFGDVGFADVAFDDAAPDVVAGAVVVTGVVELVVPAVGVGVGDALMDVGGLGVSGRRSWYG